MPIRLKLQIDAIAGLEGLSSTSRAFMDWRRQTEEVLGGLFGPKSAQAEAFAAIYFTPVFLTCRMSDDAFDQAYENGLREARALLLSFLKSGQGKSQSS